MVDLNALQWSTKDLQKVSITAVIVHIIIHLYAQELTGSSYLENDTLFTGMEGKVQCVEKYILLVVLEPFTG